MLPRLDVQVDADEHLPRPVVDARRQQVLAERARAEPVHPVGSGDRQEHELARLNRPRGWLDPDCVALR